MLDSNNPDVSGVLPPAPPEPSLFPPVPALAPQNAEAPEPSSLLAASIYYSSPPGANRRESPETVSKAERTQAIEKRAMVVSPV